MKKEQLPTTEVSETMIQNLIYVVRKKQVMIDSDLAMLYNVETGALNRAVKRNEKRFPENFCFQLTTEEYENLKCQFGISSVTSTENGHGGRRTLPYVFTEQGIAMLSAILKSETAIQVSIRIMDAFVQMRHFLTSNALLLERISNIELKQLEYQQHTDSKIEQIFEYIADHEESSQKIFFNGQIYDAFSLLINLIATAEHNLILIDNYVNIDTLNLLSKKKPDVTVIIYTNKNTKLTTTDIDTFNKQYPHLKLKYIDTFHDRFLIIDNTYAYHIGASIKDAGKKCFGINAIEDAKIIENIIQHLRSNAN